MDISHIVETIKAIPAPPSPPELETALPPLPTFQLSEVGRAARSERKLTVFAGAAALTVGGYLALFVHGFWGTALCVGAIVMASISVSLKGKFEVAYRDAKAKWDEQRPTWLAQAGPATFEETRKLFLSLAETYSGLPAKERELLGELEKTKRERQFTSYMKSQLIERAKIPGVGQSRKATLASYGFANALDVKIGVSRSFQDLDLLSLGRWKRGQAPRAKNLLSTRQLQPSLIWFNRSKARSPWNALGLNKSSQMLLIS
ncbi:hypothetical protein RvVAT039_pl02630 (plasmid) [Agrobacterium vitis]|uniref:hypothetical protein n=1 Tax=Agrobacterium vitis TaxID=373 RepID=UPI0015DC8F48|nr:hypothetical protein [Agrobacterium vitis]BCH67430.1 hypothetical protein RvVAT039_pl02630 [Agrobacterium vitis]